MTSQHDKAKRWRPRFSVRTLVIVVTLVCCYAACWGPTKKRGVDDVAGVASFWVTGGGKVTWPDSELVWPEARASLPLVVGISYDGDCHYYFWFLGYVAKLPYEREVEVETSDFLSLPRPEF